MNSYKKYIIPLLALALLLGGWESVRSFFMANVIQPIALVVWAAWRIVASVDQVIYWVLLILACFLLLMRLIPHGSDNQLKAAYNYTYRSGNRVEYWQSLLREAVRGEEETDNLRESIKKLLVSAMQDTKGSAPLDLEKIVATKKVPLSPETQRFLFPSERFEGKHSSPFKGLLLLPAWLRSRIEKLEQQDTRAIDEILGWIETEMEINNDR